MADAQTSINSPSLTLTPQGFADAKMVKLQNEKKAAREFQMRKHADWNENYELYRNKVKTNRLTQRQTVNVPLMKETIKTLLSGVDDAPDVEWVEKSGDELKAIVYQQIWDDMFKKENLEIKDIQDKKCVFIYGLSTKFLNLRKDGVSVDILDPFDVLYDPLAKPLEIESNRFIVRQNIFRTLREIIADDRYTKEGKEQLKQWMATDKGIIQSGKNKIEWEKSMERMRSMGVMASEFPVFAGGDVIVNLTEHYTSLWDPSKQEFVRHVVTYADDTIELLDEKLEDLIGVTEWPFDVWSEDIETNDVYPDGVADLVRTPNKILNIWFSQQVENRTLQNFQMHWFDATQQGYTPQTYEPGPGRMLPAPGDPNKTIMPVQVNGLDETFTAMNYIISMVERGSGATAILKGEAETGQQTLGEVQLLVGKAAERSKTMAKFYRASWYRLAIKWSNIMQANSFPKMNLYKTGADGTVYEKVAYNGDWKSQAGYDCTVASSSEQESDQVQTIQKFSYALQQSPNNSVLKGIMQKRTLKLLDLSAAEMKEVENEELKMKEQLEQQMAMQNMLAMQQGQPAEAPQQPEQQGGVDPQQMEELKQAMLS